MSGAVCPKCGSENRAAAKFCQKCGQPLSAAPAAPPAAPRPAGDPGTQPPSQAGIGPAGTGARISPLARPTVPQGKPADASQLPTPNQPGAPAQGSASDQSGGATKQSAPSQPGPVIPPTRPLTAQGASDHAVPPSVPQRPPAPPSAASTSSAGRGSAPATPAPVTNTVQLAAAGEGDQPVLSPEQVAGRPTVPLQEAAKFAALPRGALLDDERYEVLDYVAEGNINIYKVVGVDLHNCPRCGREHSGAEHRFCADCGAELFSGGQVYAVREAPGPGYWDREVDVAKAGIFHPSLVNVYRCFTERPHAGADERHYSVSDSDDGRILTDWPRPVTEETALVWGQQLAQALDAVHKKGFRHGHVTPDAVSVSETQARLGNLSLAMKMVKAAGPDWGTEEIQSLVKILRDDILAGQSVSPATQAIFDKAQAPSRASRYATAEALAEDLGKALEALRKVGNLALVSGRLSHVGMVRDHNEDSVATLELQRTQLSEAQTLGLYVVADGMGGHAAGEVASGLAIQAVVRSMLEKLSRPWVDGADLGDCAAALKEAVGEANHAVNDRARKTHTDMGTTCVTALVVGSDVYIANVGDSRCYHIGSGQIKQVSVDHSLVQRLVDAGQITAEQARNHPQKNYIYRTIGDKPQVEVDLFTLTLKPGDMLLLCSDGLSGLVEDAELHRIAAEAPNPQIACERLVEMANRNGGDDNVTTVVVTAVQAKGNR